MRVLREQANDRVRRGTHDMMVPVAAGMMAPPKKRRNQMSPMKAGKLPTNIAGTAHARHRKLHLNHSQDSVCRAGGNAVGQAART